VKRTRLSVSSEVVLYPGGSRACGNTTLPERFGIQTNDRLWAGEVFELHPVRRIICGVALCFLAALLATEAKAAWVANAGSSPSDITAVKLCPVAGKQLQAAIDVPLARSHNPIDSIHVIAVCQCTTPFAQWSISSTANPQSSGTPLELSYFSPPLFLRPPPAL
jgi:hypothetical protein